jgi:kynurenine formamidase
MKASIEIAGKEYEINLNEGRSISTPFYGKNHLPRAFYSPQLDIEPVRMDNWVGSTAEGGILNFKNIFINPHGNGTHTECLGHIAVEPYLIKDCLTNTHQLGQLITIDPEKLKDDYFISLEQVQAIHFAESVNCLMIRTLPNQPEDKIKDWSGTNPCYISYEAMEFLVKKGIEHFMIDTPSVDREEDEGKLLAHKAFWNYPSDLPRLDATITEMIYAPDDIQDGLYIVNIQTLPLAMDASPSNILLYKVKD